ncbi:hypothetical protein ACN38_g10794 [Penicillium nordicum]|uniref:AA1-like domain-containing protein n=1 Tax=Penicillium nordicum TaxID=229535 RepID=A0A0M8NSA9_9EURO|nr:hypothetical protein ACN38_g10794 [Penicillium nordicum]
MKFSLLAAAAIAPMVSAHYFFDTLVINGKETFESNTRTASTTLPNGSTSRDDMTPDVLEFRCNKGAFSFADTAGTAECSTLVPPSYIYSMSKAPSTAKQYQGDGEWFKIYQESVYDEKGLY